MEDKAMLKYITWLEAECWEVCARKAGRPRIESGAGSVVEVTAAGVRGRIVPMLWNWARGVGSKTMRREVGQEGRGRNGGFK
jgi:hypothetical protein